MSTALLAFVRDRYGRTVGEFSVRPSTDDLIVEFSLSHMGRPYEKALTPLLEGRVHLIINGTLCVQTESQQLIHVDEIINNLSQCPLQLVYNPDAIELAEHMAQDIAKQQSAVIPFGELVVGVKERLRELDISGGVGEHVSGS